MATIDERFTNFPFGPVPLSPTWRAYKAAGCPESERTPSADGPRGEAFKALKGHVIPAPTKISQRSTHELTSPASPPNEAASLLPVLDDRLYFMTMPDNGPKRVDPQPRACYYYFTTEKSLRYFPFSNDFGPLNLGQTVKFIRRLNAIINNPEHSRCRIVYYCPNRPDRISNACTLLAIYLLAVCKLKPQQVLDRFKCIPFKPYRDASYGQCTYKMTLADCVGAIDHAIHLGWFDWAKFDLEFYEYHEMIDHGDLNWTIPGKFVAFSSPMMERFDPEGYMSNTPDDYVPIFKSIGVTDIVRLNDNQYDRNIFLRNGFQHHDLTYPDGSIPNDERINKFLSIADAAKGVIAVHCKAGLGRTGSMMGIYAIRNYNWTGRHWVAWNRICRPGSVLGPQQQWLTVYERAYRESLRQIDRAPVLIEGGIEEDTSMEGHSPRGTQGGVRSPIFPQEGKPAHLNEMPTSYQINNPASRDTVLETVLDKEQRRIAIEGDFGQAERLVSAKRRHDLEMYQPSTTATTSKADGKKRTFLSQSKSKSDSAASDAPHVASKLSSFFGSKSKSPRGGFK